MMIYDHSLFWRTRRAISAGGFFATIHNITDVAAARAYLEDWIRKDLGVHGHGVGTLDGLPCENILCMIISEVDLRRSPNWDPPGLSIPSFQ